MRISTSLAVAIAVGVSRLALAQESLESSPPTPSAATPEAPPAAPVPYPPGAGTAAPPPGPAAFATLPAAAPPPRPPWRPRDAHVAIALEHVLAYDALTIETDHDVSPYGVQGDSTMTRSTFPFAAFRNGAPRLAVDVLFGGTVGAFVSYSRNTYRSTVDDPMMGRVDGPEVGSSGGLAGVRGGVILGQGATVALWLRGGGGYAWSVNIPASEGTSWGTVFVEVDPVLIIAPVRHFAITVGPYLEGARGESKHRSMDVVDPGEHTWIDFNLRFVSNVSVMF